MEKIKTEDIKVGDVFMCRKYYTCGGIFIYKTTIIETTKECIKYRQDNGYENWCLKKEFENEAGKIIEIIGTIPTKEEILKIINDGIPKDFKRETSAGNPIDYKPTTTNIDYGCWQQEFIGTFQDDKRRLNKQYTLTIYKG